MGVFVLFPIAAALAVWFKRRFELMVFPAIGLITITLAITGIAGFLVVGVYAALVYVIAAMVILFRKKKLITKYVLTPGFAAFCVYLILFLVFSQGRYFMSAASKTIYGPSILSLIKNDSLQDHCLYYKLNDPFPLGTLWAYFCTKLIGGYAEWKCILAYDVLTISGVLPLFYQVKTIKEENWQWLMITAIGLFLPLLKVFDAFRSFDMLIPQTTAMIYTFYVVYRMLHGNERKGDVLFAAYGFFVSCAIAKYGMFIVLPLTVSCCAMAIRDKERRKSLLTAVMAGYLITFLSHLYLLFTHEIGLKELFYTPASLIGALLIGTVIFVLIDLYNKGKHVTAVIAFLALIAITSVVVVIVLNQSIYKDYVTEEVVEFTDKLFVGALEEDYVIGKRVIRIYDTTFLFLLLAVSGIAHRKVGKKNKEGTAVLDTFHAAYVYGVFLYFLVLCVLYINVIRMPKANPIPAIATYTAPVIVLSTTGLLLQAVRVWKKNIVLLVGGGFLLACVYTDPVGEIFNKSEREYVFPVIQQCIESGKIQFTEEDRVFYMDPQLYQDLSIDFKWEVYPAGADAISGLYYNADPYHWSGGEIQYTMTVEELEEVIREGKYTYVYLDNIGDFQVNKYHALFAEVGQGMVEDAIYRVDYGKDGDLQLVFLARD